MPNMYCRPHMTFSRKENGRILAVLGGMYCYNKNRSVSEDTEIKQSSGGNHEATGTGRAVRVIVNETTRHKIEFTDGFSHLELPSGWGKNVLCAFLRYHAYEGALYAVIWGASRRFQPSMGKPMMGASGNRIGMGVMSPFSAIRELESRCRSSWRVYRIPESAVGC